MPEIFEPQNPEWLASVQAQQEQQPQAPPETPPEPYKPPVQKIQERIAIRAAQESKLFTPGEIEKAGLKSAPKNWEVEGYQPWYYKGQENRQLLLQDVARAREINKALDKPVPQFPDMTYRDMAGLAVVAVELGIKPTDSKSVIKGQLTKGGLTVKQYNKLFGKVTPAKAAEVIKQAIETAPKNVKELTEREAQAYLRTPEGKKFYSENVQLPDGSYANYSELQRLKKEHPEAYKILTTKGFDAYFKYSSSIHEVQQVAQLKKADDLAKFEQKNVRLPKDPDVWIDKNQLDALKKNSPAQYNLLMASTFNDYKQTMADAKAYVDKNYKTTSTLPGSIGKYDLARAPYLIKSLDSKEYQYLALMFNKEDIKPVTNALKYKKAGEKYPEINKIQKVVPILPVLAVGTPVALIEPTPFGEAILAAVSAGMIAYAGYKLKDVDYAALGSEIRRYVSDFRKEHGRQPKVEEVNINIKGNVVPLTALTPLIVPAEIGDSSEKLIPPGIKPINERLIAPEIKTGGESIILPTIKPADEQLKPPEVKRGQEQIIVPNLPDTSIKKAETAVKEAENELKGIVIKPNIIAADQWDKLLYGIQIKKTSENALTALDKAVIDAFQSGEIKENEFKAYQKARNEYLLKRLAYDDATKTYIGGQMPKIETTQEINYILTNYPKATPKTVAKIKTGLKDAMREATKAYIKALNENMTKLQAQTRAEIAAQNAYLNMTNTITNPQAKAQTQTKAAIKTATKVATKVATREATRTAEATTTAEATLTDETTTTTKFRLPSGGKGEEEEWTPTQVKSAIAWKDGIVVHALKSPYRRGIDEKTFSIKNVPKGLAYLDIKGKGSQQASAKVVGRLPRKLTVDVGFEDVVITPAGRNRIKMRHTRDTRGSVSQMTIKRGHSISKKKGRIYQTSTSGGKILSRKPLGGY